MNIKIQSQPSRDMSISFVRMLSMLFIVFSHVAQYFNHWLAWWLNVGVQIFLFISGYLYSTKKCNSIEKFMKKQILKLLLGYYLLIIMVIAVTMTFFKNELKKTDIAALFFIFGSGSFTPLKHLWFIRYIFICYIFLPLFQKMLNWCDRKKYRIIFYIIFVLLLEIISIVYVNHLDFAYINCFFVGMMYKRLENTEAIKMKGNLIIVFIAVCLCVFKAYIIYFRNIEFTNTYTQLVYDKFCSYSHLVLGVAVFIILRKIYRVIHGETINKLLILSDNYSYEVYLCHQVFIFGRLSIYDICDNAFVATIALFGITAISAFSLKFVSEKIKSRINVL